MGENRKVNTEGEDSRDSCPTPPPAEECASACNSVDRTAEPIAMQEAQNDGDAQVGDAAADQGGDGFTLVGQKKRKKREPNNASKTPLDYVRLAFPEGTTKKEKMKWLQDIGNPSSNLRGTPIDLVRGDTLSSPYIYVARSQQSYIENLTGGLIGGITFKSCDEKKKSEKYDEYLVTHYNKDLDLDNAYALDGVHKDIRVYKDGQPLNRIRIVWKGEQPPPSTYNFFGKYMPTSHVRPWRASPVICYNCMGSGHVAKYCKDKARCAACGEQHSAKECPRSAAGREPAADAPSFVPSCFRCGKAGVTAWHWGCTALPALAPPPLLLWPQHRPRVPSAALPALAPPPHPLWPRNRPRVTSAALLTQPAASVPGECPAVPCVTSPAAETSRGCRRVGMQR